MAVAVFHLAPPYREFRPASQPRPPLGTIQALAVSAPAIQLDELSRRAAELRRRAPASPLILWAPDSGLEQLPQLACVLGDCAIRGLVIGRRTEFLREQLSSSIALAGAVARWTVDTAGVEDRRLAADLHGLLHQAARCTTAGTSVRRLGGAERTWRARFRTARLPSPGRWVHMMRCLLPALALQRDPHRPVADIAVEFGAYDASRLAARLRSTFHCGPTGIRQVLGFEPLLDAWLRGDRGPVPVPRSIADRHATAGTRPPARDGSAPS